MAVLFHRFSGHAYPHLGSAGRVPMAPSISRRSSGSGPSEADIDRVIAESGEVFDILKPDSAQLIQAVERTVVERDRDVPRCADVMSRDVVTVLPDTRSADARALLLERNLRILPVIANDGRVAGVVGLRDLDESSGIIYMESATARHASARKRKRASADRSALGRPQPRRRPRRRRRAHGGLSSRKPI